MCNCGFAALLPPKAFLLEIYSGFSYETFFLIFVGVNGLHKCLSGSVECETLGVQSPLETVDMLHAEVVQQIRCLVPSGVRLPVHAGTVFPTVCTHKSAPEDKLYGTAAVLSYALRPLNGTRAQICYCLALQAVKGIAFREPSQDLRRTTSISLLSC